MGVEGLWQYTADAASKLPLLEAARDFKLSQGRPIRLGIDMSTLMGECTGATLSAGVNGQFHGGALSILFTKYSFLLKIPASIICVYDGPERPDKKRGVNVKKRPPYWEKPSKELARCFGFHVHQAPGEAEAELAALNIHGLIDGVITSDSDILVFGAPMVYRTIPNKKKEFDDDFLLYNHTRLSQELGLTRGGLILFALLRGGDYDAGVETCGPAFAHGLARCGFGDQLIEAVQTLNNDAYAEFLKGWRIDLKWELTFNRRKLLPRREPRIARALPQNFPDRRVLDLYLNPITSWSATPPRGITDAPWDPQQPSIIDITKFGLQHLGWTPGDELKQKFNNVLWESIFLQMVYSSHHYFNPHRPSLTIPGQTAIILEATRKVRKGHYASRFGDTPQPRLKVSAQKLVPLMGDGFEASASDVFWVWADESLLPKGMIAMLDASNTKTARRNAQSSPTAEKSPARTRIRRSAGALKKKADIGKASGDDDGEQSKGKRRKLNTEIIDLTSD